MTVLFEPVDETTEVADLMPPHDIDEPPTDATSEAPFGYTATGRIRKRPVGLSAGVGRKQGASNEKMARQAAVLLAQTNNLMCMGFMATGLVQTAKAISVANDTFEDQAYNALLPDPALCRTILKAGGTSSKLSLLIAYGMLAAAVAPTAIQEAKPLIEARKNKDK